MKHDNHMQLFTLAIATVLVSVVTGFGVVRINENILALKGTQQNQENTQEDLFSFYEENNFAAAAASVPKITIIRPTGQKLVGLDTKVNIAVTVPSSVSYQDINFSVKGKNAKGQNKTLSIKPVAYSGKVVSNGVLYLFDWQPDFKQTTIDYSRDFNVTTSYYVYDYNDADCATGTVVSSGNLSGGLTCRKSVSVTTSVPTKIAYLNTKSRPELYGYVSEPLNCQNEFTIDICDLNTANDLNQTRGSVLFVMDQKGPTLTTEDLTRKTTVSVSYDEFTKNGLARGECKNGTIAFPAYFTDGFNLSDGKKHTFHLYHVNAAGTVYQPIPTSSVTVPSFDGAPLTTPSCSNTGTAQQVNYRDPARKELMVK